MIGRRRRERDALGGRLDSHYPPQAPDPYTGHLPEQYTGRPVLDDEDDDVYVDEVEVPKKPRRRLRARLAHGFGTWRRTYLPLPDEVVEEYLGHGERMIHNDHPSFRAFLIEHLGWAMGLVGALVLFVLVISDGNLVGGAFLFVVACVIALVLVLMRLSDRYTSYVITNVRIMRIAGVVTRRVHSIPWMRVTDLSYDQNWLGRLLGYATLHIESANEESGLRNLAGISKPMVFNQYLVDMVVAKQGPIAPGWEELGQAGPAGVLPTKRRVGLRDRVREVRRRRREHRTGGYDVQTTRGRPPSRAPSARRQESAWPDEMSAEEVPTSSPGRPADRASTRSFTFDDDGDRHGEDGPDPLREGPESSVPWGRG